MTIRFLFYRCGICDGRLIEDDETGEISCSECGLCYEDLSTAKPMDVPRKPFEEYKKYIQEAKTTHIKTREKHAGGRPRTRKYIRLQAFVLASFERRVPSLRLKMSSPINDMLWTMITDTFKRALVEYYEPTGFTWVTKEGKQRHSRRWKGQFLRCKKHAVYDDGATLEFTIEVKRSAPRIRYSLPCGCRQDLRLRCPFCGWFIETTKNGFFRCSNPKGSNYPKKCLSFPVEKVEQAVEEEFGSLGN